MKVSKRLALSAVAVTGIAMAFPALADKQGGTGGPLHCTDMQGNQMDGTITWSPTNIWPPNHKMVPVTINYTDDDNDGGATGENIAIQVTNITDNQVHNGIEDGGAGHTAVDWTLGTPGMASDPGTATTTPTVRAERSGKDKDGGRVYTITVQCSEQGGVENANVNTSDPTTDTGTATLTVKVPHDQGNN